MAGPSMVQFFLLWLWDIFETGSPLNEVMVSTETISGSERLQGNASMW